MSQAPPRLLYRSVSVQQLLEPFLISILPQQPLQLLVWFRRLRKSPSLSSRPYEQWRKVTRDWTRLLHKRMLACELDHTVQKELQEVKHKKEKEELCSTHDAKEKHLQEELEKKDVGAIW
ncbi:hypothetical protein PRIPAC_88099, partial [Pristionchus pacificus]